MEQMQKIIDDFCIGPLNVSTERRYLAPKIGGLGLIKVSDFLVSQHCMWVKRTAQSTRDIWIYLSYVTVMRSR